MSIQVGGFARKRGLEQKSGKGDGTVLVTYRCEWFTASLFAVQ